MNGFSLGPGAIERGGTFCRTILPASATGGAVSIVDSVSLPAGGRPRHVPHDPHDDPHDHVSHDADEAFVILTGNCEFRIEGARFTRGPGQSAFIPRGQEHMFRVVGTIPCATGSS